MQLWGPFLHSDSDSPVANGPSCPTYVHSAAQLLPASVSRSSCPRQDTENCRPDGISPLPWDCAQPPGHTLFSGQVGTQPGLPLLKAHTFDKALPPHLSSHRTCAWPRLPFWPLVPVLLAFFVFSGVYHQDILLVFVVKCAKRQLTRLCEVPVMKLFSHPSICGCPLPSLAPSQHCARGDVLKGSAPSVLRARTMSCAFSWALGHLTPLQNPNAMTRQVANVEKDRLVGRHFS